jgi:glycosyltransferase involved in cell wall biosynthesis
MKVLMISTDRNILTPGSAVSERMKEYGHLVEELHIVVLSDTSHGLKNTQIEKNIWAYPTSSMFKFLRPLDAAKIGKRIVFDRKFVRGQSVVTTQDPFECGWAGLQIKKKWRIPLEVQLHTTPFTQYFSGWLNNVRKRIAQKVLRNADGVRVMTESLKEQVMHYTNAHIFVLPIYIDRVRIEETKIAFDLRARYGWQFTILIVSRLAPEKNIPLALNILKQVREKFSNVGLVIVGSGSEEKNLKLKVKSLKLEGAVEFVGWQDNLASFYKTANAFLQTSFFEGYGLSLVEAGLSGLPVVTTPVGIAEELEHGKDAYIYPSSRPDLFVGGILDLIENNNKRENLRTNMRATLEAKLLSKGDYLKNLNENWVKTASLV